MITKFSYDKQDRTDFACHRRVNVGNCWSVLVELLAALQPCSLMLRIMPTLVESPMHTKRRNSLWS